MAQSTSFSNIKINLNPKVREEITSIFFQWVISIGKAIIVITELAALSAVFYRFVIDRQIIDLHDRIKRAEILVKAQDKKEKEYRQLQERLTSVKTLIGNTDTKISVLNQILSEVKKNGFLTTKFNLNQNLVAIEGKAPSVFGLADFINKLKNNETISGISLNQVNSLQQGVDFQINITLKEK